MGDEPTSSPGFPGVQGGAAAATEAIDAGWGDDEPEANAGAPGEATPPSPAVAASAPAESPEEGESERITAPPPMPESEYVAAMMGGAGEEAEATDPPPIPRAAPLPAIRPATASPRATAPAPRPAPPRAPRPPRPGGEGRPSPREGRGGPDIEASEVDPAELEALGLDDLDLDAAPTATALPGEIEELYAVEIDDAALVEEVRRLEFDLSETVEAPIYEPDGVRAQIDEVSGRIAAEDYSGALILAEGVLEEAPEHPRALAYAELCRAKLRTMYLSRLGEVTQVPAVVGSRAELNELLAERGVADLLVRIDGESSLEAVLRGSSVPELDALRLLFELVQQGVVTMRRPA